MSDESSKPGTTHFGFRDVPTGDKQKLVGEVFSSVAGSYDLMNDLMSLGIHRVWKRYFVSTAQVRTGDRVLDLAGGTGDIAALLKPRVGESGELVLGDINASMLRVGRDRMTDRGNVRGFEYVQCNAETLPFPDALSGLVLHLLDRMPVEGDAVTVGSYVLTVDSLERRRVGKLRIASTPDEG